MTTGESAVAEEPELKVGDRLPALRLTRATGQPGAGGEHPAETTSPLRGPHRDGVVVVALHDPGCEACVGYLRQLADARDRFRLWDGTVLALTDAEAGARRLAATLRPSTDAPADGVVVLVDPDRSVLDRLPAARGPVVVVADRYGQLFRTWTTAADHAVPGPRELEEWLQYLATQCPE